MRILIDANIYLNYYRQSPQSYDSINKLIKLLDDEDIKLIVPKQVSDEFERNKEKEAFRFIKALKENTKEMEIREPSFYSRATKIKQLKSLFKKASQLKTEIITEYKERIENENSKINRKLEKLFSMKIENYESNEIVQRAYFRTIVGNPPRKGNDSFGDAIIWEILLEYYTNDDLTIISGDGDFSREDERDSNKINLFLEKEWSRKTNKKIKLYKTLGEFINSFTKEKTIDEEVILEEKKYGEYNINSILGLNNVASGLVNSFDLDTIARPLNIADSKGIFASALVKNDQVYGGIYGVCPYCGTLIVDGNKPCSNCGRLNIRLQNNN